jgi:PAS domain S-box-containing protein
MNKHALGGKGFGPAVFSQDYYSQLLARIAELENQVGELARPADTVESRQAQAELYESEKRFRQLVEGATEGIYINTGHRFRYLNSAALSLFGADTAEQLVGQSVLERYHPSYRAVGVERMRILLEERTAVPVIEQQCIRLDGTVSTLRSRPPFNFEGAMAQSYTSAISLPARRANRTAPACSSTPKNWRRPPAGTRRNSWPT